MDTTAARRLGTAALCLSLLVAGVAACGDEDETAVQQAEEAGAEDLVVGETMTIEGEVERRIGPYAFTVGRDETLVYGSENFDVDDDDVVTVTGTVTEFVIADVEPVLGLDLDDDLFIDYENELAVEATSVEITEEG